MLVHDLGFERNRLEKDYDSSEKLLRDSSKDEPKWCLLTNVRGLELTDIENLHWYRIGESFFAFFFF